MQFPSTFQLRISKWLIDQDEDVGVSFPHPKSTKNRSEGQSTYSISATAWSLQDSPRARILEFSQLNNNIGGHFFFNSDELL